MNTATGTRHDHEEWMIRTGPNGRYCAACGQSVSAARPWAEVSARAGRNDLPYLLFTNLHQIDPADLPQAVTNAWQMAEWPEQHADQELWLMAFEMAGFTVDGEPADRAVLPETMTLYRGCTPERLNGMSWTTDLKTAQWFAKRFGDEGEVYQIEIPSEFVLAKIDGRKEAEVVVDTLALDMEEEATEVVV